MSRSYNMQVRVCGFRPDRQPAIQAAAEVEWDFSNWWQHDDWLSASQDGSLAGGETEEEFADRIARAIWTANAGCCRVEICATCLEDLPCDTHVRDEASYRSLSGNTVEEHQPGSFVLYDHDARQLLSTTVYSSHAAAASDAAGLNDVLIIQLPIPPENVEEDGVEAVRPCDCELPGEFCSGVPGILAHLENGRVAPGCEVERCDLCQRYPSDEAARDKLKELGL